MSTNTEDNSPYLEEVLVPPTLNENETEITNSEEPQHLTAECELEGDKQSEIKIDESHENDTTEDEQANTKRSRELKLLLALSKEANLDVNISHKRKSLDPVKLKELSLTPSKLENDVPVKKSRIDKFPITAECELESVAGDSSTAIDNSNVDKAKREEAKLKEGSFIEERRNIKDLKVFKPDKDMFCWRCHRESVNISCETCPRSYHQKCLKQTIADTNNWPCPECVAILKAESTQTRSPAMRGMTLEHLCSLLKFAVKRMIECNGSEPFHHPVNDKLFPEYKKYIIQPMNLISLEKNIKENLYGSTQAFEADAKWILHNSIIFNSYQSKLTTSAKMIIKICKQEMAEIENCPSCYLNANTKKSTWFVEVCPKPHILVWAKLKGFPYWPAKAMCQNNSGMVDVRFFGAHDRAWVPSKECFLYSRRDPNSNKQKRNDIIECMREVEIYIANIKALYGEFNYAPFKLQYDPDNELKQLLLFIPRYKPNAPPPKRRIKVIETKAKPKKEENDEKKEPELKEEAKEIIEGYGTDDETLDNENLDTTRRKLLLQQEPNAGPSRGNEESGSSSSEEEEEEENNIEPELDDDTQASSNIPDDKMPRGAVKNKIAINTTPGKLKIPPRRISEESTPMKRLSPDELSPPSKIARRNSDQSIKSDSSRLSSLSDKINRVDISENIELTLGNTADSYITSSTGDSETRKKPVQVDVENSELTISPQSKTKIADRLMQKLSSSDEDISHNDDDKTDSNSKLRTDTILERYKDLVKKKSMEFSNVEASTSFGTTSVVSTEICVSSDDGVKNKQEEKIDPLDKLVSPAENGNEDTSESEENVNNEMDISSTESPKINTNEVEIENIGEPEEKSDTTVASSDGEKTEVLCEAAVENDEQATTSSSMKRDKEKNSTLSEEADSNNEETNSMNVDSENISNEKIIEKTIHAVTQTEIKKPKKLEATEVEKPEKQALKPDVKSKEETPTIIIEKAKVTPGLQVKSKAAMTNNVAKFKITEYSPKAISEGIIMKTYKSNDKKINNEFEIMPRTDSKKMITYSRKDRKSIEVKRKDSPVIQQPTDSNSSDDQELVLDDTQIDETNIRNIIHSSLNIVQTSKKTINENVDDEAKTLKRKTHPSPEEASNKKIKISQVEKEPNFKIVPIQHILNKKIDRKSPEKSIMITNPILLKKLSQPKEVTSVIAPYPLECVEIKSEPESEEELEESQYMEAKRKYMSALNISEKSEDVVAPKKNEIRTRSKTEELGKGRQMDNLSRVIEEVATTFSAKHETQKKVVERKPNNAPPATPQASEERRKAPPQENGEIFVKSFAKMAQQPQPQVRTIHRPQPSQKPKPIPSVNKTTVIQSVRREVASKPNNESIPQTTATRINSTPISNSNTSSTTSTTNKTIESLSSSGNVLILTQPGVILPTTQQLTYNAGSFVTFVPSQQNMAMMQSPQVINAVMAPSLHQNETAQQNHPNSELNRSQNYIPQNEDVANNMNRPISSQTVVNSSNNITHHLQNRDIPSLIPITDNDRNTVPTSSNNRTEARVESTEDEFSILHSMLPENVSKAISDVLCRPPPKLRPRPPGPLSQVFDSGNPSSAGPVSAKINSISHRLGDYFRGMLVEMLEDLGKVNNPEATIASLKHEIESLQQKHASEMMDIRKNVCTILKDIQGSIVEERERLVDETRSACEIEALRRIEEAKSKQWCANCGKEAQFYCCWNTSYCDYSCQIKQWSKHMSKCTQHAGQSQPPAQSPAVRPQSQLTFRPAPSKAFAGRLITKPTKVYLNRATNSKSIPTFKSTAGGHLTLVDTSNLEFLANSPGTKFIASSSLFTRVRNVNSTVTSPSNGTRQTETPIQKVISSGPIVRASLSTSNNGSTNVISDEEMESD